MEIFIVMRKSRDGSARPGHCSEKFSVIAAYQNRGDAENHAQEAQVASPGNEEEWYVQTAGILR